MKKKTTYRVDYKTDELITLAAKAIKDLPEIKSPSIRSTKIGITMTDEGVGTNYVGEKVESYGRLFLENP
jgi:type III restriction enzyme